MEAIELKKLLDSYNHQLDGKLQININTVENLAVQKTQKTTQTIFVYRIIELVSFSVFAVLLSAYTANHWSITHLAVSGAIVNLVALLALIGSIVQVVTLSQINFAGPVLEIRKKIEQVNAHSLLFVKLLFLSAPVWWAYALVGLDVFLGLDIYVHLDPDFVVRYLAVNALLIFPLLWAFNKISFKNMHLPWVQKTIQIFTGKHTHKAMQFLHEIENFEK